MGRRGCESYRTLISALLDGELDPDERIHLDSHLARCESCRQVLDDYGRISGDFRNLPPLPPPPPDLARAVRKATVERPPDPRWVRWFGLGSPRLGLSAMATLALLVIACSFLLVNGYRQSLSPAIAVGSGAADQNWPIYQPVRIEFTKPMNHASVEAGLRIVPVGERERLPLGWDGNTLVIGSDGSHSELLLPDTSYTVVVLADVRDVYGNPLGAVWTRTFHTGHSNVALASPIATSPPSASTPTRAAGTEPPAPSMARPQATADPQPSLAPSPPAPTRQPAVAGADAVSTPTSGAAIFRQTSPVSAGSHRPSPTPTETPAAVAVAETPSPTAATTPRPTKAADPTEVPATQPAATATQAPSPSTSGTAGPTAPATAAVTATSTATRAPTATPTASTPAPTAAVVPVAGAFGSVYWANADVQAKLGAATAVDAAISAQELGFQRGTMYERLDNDTIYSLLTTGNWSAAKDSWTAAEPAGGGSCGEPNLFQPKNGFYKLWSGDATLKAAIGCANKSDASVEAGRVQQFANGAMLYSEQGFVYVLYNDGTWKLYPDTSGHGTLLTPTPTAGPTATVTPAATAKPTPAGTATPTATPAPTPTSTPRP